MWEEMTGQKVDQLVILISCDEGEVQVFKKNINDYKDTLKAAIVEWKLAKLNGSNNELLLLKIESKKYYAPTN